MKVGLKNSSFIENFSWYRLKTPQIRLRIEIFVNIHLLMLVEEIFSRQGGWCENRVVKTADYFPLVWEPRVRGSRHVSGWSVMMMVSCDWIWITMTESLDHGVSSHLTLHTPTLTGHPLCLSTSDICILTFAAALCSVQLLQSVYDRSQIYCRAPAGQWSVCSIWSPVANNVRVLSSLHH